MFWCIRGRYGVEEDPKTELPFQGFAEALSQLGPSAGAVAGRAVAAMGPLPRVKQWTTWRKARPRKRQGEGLLNEYFLPANRKMISASCLARPSYNFSYDRLTQI